MIEALLFDFNGVIADDEEQHRAALGVVLAGEGLSLTPQQYYSDFLGFDDRRCLIEAFRRAGKTLPPLQLERLLAQKSRVYQELIDRSLALVPGAADFVPRAAERFRLGLVSGALRQEVELVLGRAGLQRYFDVLVAAEDVEQCKPDPAGYLAARGALDRRRPLPAGHCVVIEDSLPGLSAARAAGMRCAMLTTSHPSAALARAGADLVWSDFAGHDPAELLALAER
ncbi:MAG: HAD family phosphatase [Actinobacteria bacterium]|nr:MAG: HAD family phosphatase [Actinomycetota bacterium]